MRLVGSVGADDPGRAVGGERLGDVGREADMEKRTEALGEPRLRGQSDGERGGAARIVQRAVAGGDRLGFARAPRLARFGRIEFDRLDGEAGGGERRLKRRLAVAAGEIEEARPRRQRSRQSLRQRRGAGRKPQPLDEDS